MKKLILSLLFVGLLTGCSGSNNTQICKYDSDSFKVTQEIEYDENKITKQTLNQELEFGDYYSEDEVKTLCKDVEKKYDVDGVDYSYEIDADKKVIKEIITIDYTKADLDELYSLQLVEETGDYIGLKETIESLEDQGFECED